MKLIAAFLSTVILFPAEPAKKVNIFTADTVASQIVQGGGWATDIFLVNASDVKGSVNVLFFTATGTKWTPTVTGFGPTVSIALPSRNSRRITLPNVGALQQGWMQIEPVYDPTVPSDDRYRFTVGGMATFRSGWNEATVPLASEFADDSLLFFRAADGYATGLAIANPSSFTNETVLLTFRDDSGAQLASETFDMKPRNKLVLNIVDRYPQVVGRSGTIRIQATRYGVASLALIFNPGGFFTSAHSLEPI